MDLTNAQFRRSSYCDNSSGSCVEVADLPDGGKAVRSSKAPTVSLEFDATEWDAFGHGFRAGEFA